MDGSVDGVWRIGSIMVLAMLGIGFAVTGIQSVLYGVSHCAPTSGTLLRGLSGFRMAVIGLGLIGVAGAWWWGTVWLLVLSLGIVGEETLESSVMIWALKRERRVKAS